MVLQTNEARRVAHDRSAGGHRNVGDGERFASIIGGVAVALFGLDRGGLTGGALAVVGAEMVRRGASGHCLIYDALNVSTASDATAQGPHWDVTVGRAATVRASRAVKIEHSVSVEKTAPELYAFWREPANIAQVVDFIERVDRLDERHARWHARGPAGVSIQWDAEIINDVPNELIAWKSVGNADIPNAGSIHFRPAPDGAGTDVRLVVEYEPPGGHLGAWAARLVRENPDVQLRTALQRFKALAESRQQA